MGRDSEAVRAAWRAFAWSRAAIALVAVFAALSAGEVATEEPSRFDIPAVTAPFEGPLDIALSPLARWDAVWFLSVANYGYDEADSPRHAFFPLYPLLARGVGELGGGSPEAVLIASYLVALAAFLAALALLYRLTALELGRRVAWPALLLLCVFPGSLYFGAPYSESLFLLCSVGAFYAARTGRWAWAGAAVAAASGTRSAGILLLLPLVTIYLSQSGRRLRPDVLWLALAPLGLAAYAAYLWIAFGDPLSFSQVQDLWNRSFAGPFVGVWDGASAAFDGVRQLGSGSRETAYFEQAAGDPLRIAAQNLILFGFLCFAAVAVVGVLRRLPAAYGLYVVAALALPLSYPVSAQPLMSLPRFLAVLFPVFMWLAAACEQRQIVERVAIASAILLGLFVTQFATWHWVA
jgi:hypothetical protein